MNWQQIGRFLFHRQHILSEGGYCGPSSRRTQRDSISSFTVLDFQENDLSQSLKRHYYYKLGIQNVESLCFDRKKSPFKYLTIKKGSYFDLSPLQWERGGGPFFLLCNPWTKKVFVLMVQQLENICEFRPNVVCIYITKFHTQWPNWTPQKKSLQKIHFFFWLLLSKCAGVFCLTWSNPPPFIIKASFS